jgi:UDP-N-acetylmuramyl pentapeptide phosphotransferase/UDP-N-acetylglucosamine-1-phosphate transferase
MGSGPSLIAAAVLGLVGGTLGWSMLRETFAAPLFQRTNFRGLDVPVGVGVLLPVVLVAAGALLVLADRLEWAEIHDGALRTAVATATGFGLLGLLDDLAGDATAKGFAGHLRALAGGRLTTGAVKLFGGGAVAVLVSSAGSDERPGRLLADAALIALAANLANLLDRAPGRAAKVVLLAAVPVALSAGVDGRLAGPAVVAGATIALLWPDLRERLMLGDAGANVLGAVWALSVVLTTAATTRTAVLVALVVLNLASELVSFSAVIDRTPPLRALDRLGRRP